MAEAKINVKPIDYHTEKFCLCSKTYNFAKYSQDGKVTYYESPVCFATSEGYFIGLNDRDDTEYFNVEVIENDEAVAFVMGDVSTGVYGRFYDSQKFSTGADSAVNICIFSEIKNGDGVLKFVDKDGAIQLSNIGISANAPDDIRIVSAEKSDQLYPIGSAIMQDDMLVAFVTDYDAAHKEYKCISAEMMAADLCRKIYEYKVFIALQEMEISAQKTTEKY